MRRFTVSEADAGSRADVFVAAKYPRFSRSSLERLFEDGLVKLGRKAVKSSYKVKAGDKLSVDDSLVMAEPEAIDLPVIYEDENVLVIDKPEGVLSHSKGSLSDEPTVATFIKPKLEKYMPETNRAGIVHRLDRATSGVIITAKNPEALAWLQKQFSGRRTKKTYLAVVEGRLEPSSALIDVPIARNPRRPQTFRADPAGKPAQTEYSVLKVFDKAGKSFTLVELRPRTGRTHQLRVHMAYIKHPIVGDRIYGDGGDHLLLHAHKLELTLPDKSRMVFESKPPKYFTEFYELGV